jgi:drug/metabolite transporter (DMT)-like permease
MLKLHIAIFLFGLSGLFGKFLELPSTSIVLGRTLFATFALLLLLKISPSIPTPNLKNIMRAIPSGVLLAIHWVTFFYSIQISSVSIGLLSFATFPIFVILLDAINKHTKITLIDCLSTVVVFCGVVLIVPDYDLHNSIFQGVLWGTFSGLTFALLTIYNRGLVSDTHSVIIGLLQNFWATITLLPFARPLIDVTQHQLFLIAILGVFCTALAHCLFIESLKTVRAQVASISTGLEPVYGILLAAILLHEVPSIREIVGGGMILSSVIVLTLLEKKEQEL